jgi:hypothetical protein
MGLLQQIKEMVYVDITYHRAYLSVITNFFKAVFSVFTACFKYLYAQTVNKLDNE